MLLHDAVRHVMHQAALRHEIDPDRLRLVHAVESIRDAVPACPMGEAKQPLIRLLASRLRVAVQQRQHCERIGRRCQQRRIAVEQLHYREAQTQGAAPEIIPEPIGPPACRLITQHRQTDHRQIISDLRR
jgi:hypothetical protein